MGNPTRCPKCNRYGNAELDGYCRSCHADRKNPAERLFYDKIAKYMALSNRVVQGALLEVGCELPKEVKPDDRILVLNIIKKRLPTKRSGHIVRGESRLEDYSRLIREDRTEYAVEKETMGVEHD